jgi:hypothetical protein
MNENIDQNSSEQLASLFPVHNVSHEFLKRCCKNLLKFTFVGIFVASHIFLIYIIYFLARGSMWSFLYVLLNLLFVYEFFLYIVISESKARWFYSISWILFVFNILIIGDLISIMIKLYGGPSYLPYYPTLCIFLGTLPSFCVALFAFVKLKIDAMILNFCLCLFDAIWISLYFNNTFIWIELRCLYALSFIVIVLSLFASIRQLFSRSKCMWMLFSGTLTQFLIFWLTFPYLFDNDYVKCLFLLVSILLFFVGITFPSLTTFMCGILELVVYLVWFTITFHDSNIWVNILQIFIMLSFVFCLTYFNIREFLDKHFSPKPFHELPMHDGDRDFDVHRRATGFVELEMLMPAQHHSEQHSNVSINNIIE